MTWYRQRTENSGQRLLGLAVSTAHAAFYVKELFKATDTVVAPGWQNIDSHCKCLFNYFTGFSIQINYASFISLESEAQKSILLQSSPEAFEKLPDMSECKWVRSDIKLNLTAPVCVTAPAYLPACTLWNITGNNPVCSLHPASRMLSLGILPQTKWNFANTENLSCVPTAWQCQDPTVPTFAAFICEKITFSYVKYIVKQVSFPPLSFLSIPASRPGALQQPFSSLGTYYRDASIIIWKFSCNRICAEAQPRKWVAGCWQLRGKLSNLLVRKSVLTRSGVFPQIHCACDPDMAWCHETF